jgi:hypothetical protein
MPALTATIARLYAWWYEQELKQQHRENCRRAAMLYLNRADFFRRKHINRLLDDREYHRVEMIIEGLHMKGCTWEVEHLESRLEAFQERV